MNRSAPASRLAAIIAWVGLCVFAQAALAQSLPDFTKLVQKYSPAVVNISTKQKPQRATALPKGFDIPDLPEDSPLRDFLKRFFGEEGPPEEFDAESLGSGFIISHDGYILTNYHVIKNAEEILVRLSDRRELEAKVIGADERSDIALLKIDAHNLPVVKLGTHYDLKVGEWVLAIGSPFGFDHSVTAGIVSAKGRSLPRDNYVPFIQTDVAINPGNSGGPLFNLDGEVVGINSQIFSRTGGFMGLSFAIPIGVAMDVANQLRTTGHVTRGWLGVLIQDVTQELAESFGMSKPAGALVAKVLPDSPAEKAGLQVGDIVLAFDGHDVERSSDLPPIVGGTKVGSAVPVRILRDGKTRIVHVTIAKLPAEKPVTLSRTPSEPHSVTANKLNLVVKDLSADERTQLGIKDGGVLVVDVPEGPAREAGIRKDDVIVIFNNVKVKNAAHFKELAANLPRGKPVSVLVQRRGTPIFLALKTGD